MSPFWILFLLLFLLRPTNSKPADSESILSAEWREKALGIQRPQPKISWGLVGMYIIIAIVIFIIISRFFN